MNLMIGLTGDLRFVPGEIRGVCYRLEEHTTVKIENSGFRTYPEGLKINVRTYERHYNVHGWTIWEELS